MAESALSVTFGGPTASGPIPVRALAPVLVALGELLAAASVLIAPERETATLSIAEVRNDSPTIHLRVSIDDHDTRLTALVANDAAGVLEEVCDAVVGPRGLLQLARQSRNRPIVDRQPGEIAGIVRVAFEDGETIEALSVAAEL